MVNIALQFVSYNDRAVPKRHRVTGNIERTSMQRELPVATGCVDLLLADAVGAGCLMQGDPCDCMRSSLHSPAANYFALRSRVSLLGPEIENGDAIGRLGQRRRLGVNGKRSSAQANQHLLGNLGVP
jgi:hypothetical protein